MVICSMMVVAVDGIFGGVDGYGGCGCCGFVLVMLIFNNLKQLEMEYVGTGLQIIGDSLKDLLGMMKIKSLIFKFQHLTFNLLLSVCSLV